MAGKLAQLAVRRLRDRGGDSFFVAVRLPFAQQHDEQNAALAVDFNAPDHCIQVDIKMAVDAQGEALSASGLNLADLAVEDFIVGNMKARQRMLASIRDRCRAGQSTPRHGPSRRSADGIVHQARRWGGRPGDVAGPSQVARSGAGYPAWRAGKVDHKVPPADLESLQPLRPDEEAFGMTYDENDDFLEGLGVRPGAVEISLKQYDATAHQRAEPAAPMPAARQVRAPAPPLCNRLPCPETSCTGRDRPAVFRGA